MDFYAAFQRHVMVQYYCGSGSTNKLFSRCFLLLQEANEVILSVWLCEMILEGARLLELHRSVPLQVGYHIMSTTKQQ